MMVTPSAERPCGSEIPADPFGIVQNRGSHRRVPAAGDAVAVRPHGLVTQERRRGDCVRRQRATVARPKAGDGSSAAFRYRIIPANDMRAEEAKR